LAAGAFAAGFLAASALRGAGVAGFWAMSFYHELLSRTVLRPAASMASQIAART
jgi:hypothetical protein